MAARPGSRRADLGLRGSGLLLCWIGYAALARLAAMHPATAAAGILPHALGAIGFVAVSGGSAMLVLGSHLSDEVEVSARWRTLRGTDRIGSLTAMTTIEPALLVVGCDVDGSWTVREGAGPLLGRFASAQAARHFAEAERSGRTAIAIATSGGRTGQSDDDRG